jgi:hypothetical protein
VLAAVVALFGSFVLRGDVVLAQPIHDQILDRSPGRDDDERTKSFSDQLTYYVPELEIQLNGDRSGWLTTWNPHVELGRPARHLRGLSRAWIGVQVVSFVTRDGFVACTLLSFLAVLGCAVFGYALLSSLRLSPPACLVGALGLSLGVYVVYWLSFVMYVWGVCWTLALLWLVPLYLARRSFATGLGIAFAVYSLVMSAYPQQVVWHGWLMLLVFGRQLLARRTLGGTPARGRFRTALGLAFWCAAGVACTAPALLDAIQSHAQSGRQDVDVSFFFETMPKVESAKELAVYLARIFDASWFGNPVGHEYPFKVRGVSWTPVLAGLVALSFAGGSRRWWPWQVFLALALAVAFVPAVYRFGIDYLGLGFSRHAPLAGAHIPLAVLAAGAADRLLRGRGPRPVVAASVVCIPLLVAVPGALLADEALASGYFGASLFFAAGLTAFAWSRQPLLLVIVGLMSATHYSFQLRISEPRDEALRTDGISERIREYTPGGERYAWVGRQYRYLLRPNQEVLFGLRSPHAYDSVSSRRWQAWVDEISVEGAQPYGRVFRRITDATLLDAEELAAAGIGVLLSVGDLPSDLVRREHVTKGLGFWRPRRPPVLESQLLEFELSGSDARMDGVLKTPSLPAERVLDRADLLVFRVTPHPNETLLFVSQQFDPRWQCSVDGRPARAAAVAGVFQGVLVPPGGEEVRLVFRSPVRWSWIPQVLFALAFAAVSVARWGALARRARGLPPTVEGS